MATTTIEKTNEVLNIQEISIDKIKKDGREYNAAEWDKIIDRYSAYKNCKFYVAEPQKGYEYIRYYAVYEIPEGIILLNQVSYHSSLSNRGFCRVTISPSGVVRKFLLKDSNGNEGYCNNDKPNRKIMAQNSQKFDVIYTSEF